MSDVFSKKKRSEVMSRIRSRGNKDTELALVNLFRRNKIAGWRRHLKLRVGELRVDRRKRRGAIHEPSTKNHQLAVRPDFVFPKSRTAVFVDGCFWHGCPKHETKPKNNRVFWRRKFARNKQRDVLVTRTLRKTGWRVLRIWEHEFGRKTEARLLKRILRALR